MLLLRYCCCVWKVLLKMLYVNTFALRSNFPSSSALLYFDSLWPKEKTWPPKEYTMPGSLKHRMIENWWICPLCWRVWFTRTEWVLNYRGFFWNFFGWVISQQPKSLQVRRKKKDNFRQENVLYEIQSLRGMGNIF